MGLVIASIHERRETVRQELQAAAGTASLLTEQIRLARRSARRDRNSKS
jgi:CPA2 family monovalent cation:H+ antiporter-2